ncbi:hypothetical protein Tco_1117740 [Tanacetum coccineum]
MLKEANSPGVMHLIEAIQTAVNDQRSHHDTLAGSYKYLAWNLGPRLNKVEDTLVLIQTDIAKLKTDTFNIKAIVTEMFQAFKGALSSTPSRNALPKDTISKVHAYIDKMEQMEHAAKNVELSKPEIIKVVKEVVSEVGTVPSRRKPEKITDIHIHLRSTPSEIIKVVGEVVSEAEVKISGGKDFIKHPDAHLKVLHIEHSEKLRKNQEMIKLTLVAITIYQDNDIRNFEYYKEFKFGDFSLSEWDELVKKYERLKRIVKTLGINESLPLIKQDPSLPLNHKRKAIELEPETYIAGLHYNHTLPKGVEFVNNKVIDKSEHGLFFADVFGNPSFQRVSDIEKSKTEALPGYP